MNGKNSQESQSVICVKKLFKRRDKQVQLDLITKISRIHPQGLFPSEQFSYGLR